MLFLLQIERFDANSAVVCAMFKLQVELPVFEQKSGEPQKKNVRTWKGTASNSVKNTFACRAGRLLWTSTRGIQILIRWRVRHGAWVSSDTGSSEKGANTRVMPARLIWEHVPNRLLLDSQMSTVRLNMWRLQFGDVTHLANLWPGRKRPKSFHYCKQGILSTGMAQAAGKL